MAGMLEILTYLLCFYLVVKGVEVLQIGLASSRDNRQTLLWIGGLTLAACATAAFVFAGIQTDQAESLSSRASALPNIP